MADPNVIDPNDIAQVQQIDPNQIASVEQVAQRPVEAISAQPVQQQQQINPNRGQQIIDANDPTKGRFWNGVVQKASMGLVPKIADTVVDISRGNFSALRPGGLPEQPGSHEYRDLYRQSADDMKGFNPGYILNPTNSLGGSGLIQNMAVGVGQQLTQAGAGGRNPQAMDVAGNIIGTGVGHGLGAAVSGGISRFQNALAQRFGPKALEWMRQTARSILMHGSGLDDDIAQKLLKPGSSKMGLDTLEDDMVLQVFKVNPGVTETAGQTARKLASNVDDASKQIASVMDPTRQIPVDRNQISKDIFNISGEVSEGPHGPGAQKFIEDAAMTHLYPRQTAQLPEIQTFGQQTELAGKGLGPIGPQRPSVVDPEVQDMLPAQTIPMGQLMPPADTRVTSGRGQVKLSDGSKKSVKVERSTIPLGVVDEMSKGIEAQMYDPSATARLGIKNPVQSGTIANKRLEDYIRGYMTPEQKVTLDQGNIDYSTRKNVQNTMTPGLTKAGSQPVGAPGMATNAFGKASGTITSEIARKGKVIGYQGSKQIAEYAVNRLAQSDLPMPENAKNLSPFQVDQIRQKFQVLSQMDAVDAAAYAYAQSMMDPTFRAIMQSVGKEMTQQ